MYYTGDRLNEFDTPYQNRAARRKKVRQPKTFMAAQKVVNTQRRKKGKKR